MAKPPHFAFALAARNTEVDQRNNFKDVFWPVLSPTCLPQCWRHSVLQVADHCSNSPHEYCQNRLSKGYMTVVMGGIGTIIPTEQLLLKLTSVELVHMVFTKLGGLWGFNPIVVTGWLWQSSRVRSIFGEGCPAQQ